MGALQGAQKGGLIVGDAGFTYFVKKTLNIGLTLH